MPASSRQGLSQLEKMQGFVWGDRPDYGAWFDGDTLYCDGRIVTKYGPMVDVRAFGDVTQDAGKVLQQAVNAAALSASLGIGGVARWGGIVFCPWNPGGDYLFRTPVTVPDHVRILGVSSYQGEAEGVGKGTVFVNGIPTGSATSMFTCVNSTVFEGIGFEDYTASPNHTFITWNDLTHSVRDCSFQGGGVAISITEGFGNVDIERCAFVHQYTTAIDWKQAGATGSNRISIKNCIFNNDTAGVSPTPALTYIRMTAATGPSLIANITGNWFQNGHVANFVGVSLVALLGGVVQGNVFDSINQASGVCVRMNGCSGVVVEGNAFNNSYKPVDWLGVTDCTLGVNAYDGILGGNWIEVDAASIQNRIHVPTAAGTNYSIGNTPRNWVFGVRPASAYVVSKHTQVQATWNPGNIANGAIDAVDVSVPTAQIGNPCYATHDQLGTTNLSVYAYCRANGSVRVVLTNNTGGAVDIASGTLYVSVWRED